MQAQTQNQFSNAIVQGDCIDVMRAMPADSVDFILTDPPYLVNYRDRNGRSIQNDADATWLKPAMREAYRALKQNRLAVMFYGWTKVDAFFEAWREAGFQPVGHIVFRKTYSSKRRFFSYQHEHLLLSQAGLPARRHELVRTGTDRFRSGENCTMSFEIIIPFLKPIEHLLASKAISEIMVNPDGSVWIEEQGHIVLQPDIRFDEGALFTGLEVIANRFGKKLDADSPIMNLRLPDGSRMAALIPPVVNPAPMMTIRKFTSREFTMDDLIGRKMLTAEQAEQLVDAVRRGDNLLISGGTGSGKTTLANVIAGFIPDSERILILEDVAELYIRKPHVISAEAQLDTHKSQIGFADLLKAALRHRPDRIIVGEIRGPEARVFIDALNTGHRGSLTTIHANSATDALLRLSQLTLRESGGTLLNDVIAECRRSIGVIAHLAKIDGTRVVQQIARAHTL